MRVGRSAAWIAILLAVLLTGLAFASSWRFFTNRGLGLVLYVGIILLAGGLLGASALLWPTRAGRVILAVAGIALAWPGVVSWSGYLHPPFSDLIPGTIYADAVARTLLLPAVLLAAVLPRRWSVGAASVLLVTIGLIAFVRLGSELQGADRDALVRIVGSMSVWVTVASASIPILGAIALTSASSRATRPSAS